jgi:hypothetical protein
MHILALIPGLWAAAVAYRRSPEAAFLSVYLPTLLLLPDCYRWYAPGLPDPTFSQAAIIPIFLAYIGRRRGDWCFSITDLMVVGFAGVMGISEYINTNYKEAQNLMFAMVTSVIMPYVVAKGLIEPSGLRVAFVRRVVTLVFAVALISVYEFRMGISPFSVVLGRFFPGQGGWVTTFRWGFVRIAGPYGHAILAGTIMVVGYRLQRWLEWSRLWEPKFEVAPWLPLSKGRVMTLGVLAGVFMTMCKGPWIGALLAAGVTAIGRFRDRRRAGRIIFTALVVTLVPAGIALWSWASVGRAAAKTMSQETAAYRKELIDNYLEIAIEHSMWGWGKLTWPRLESMPSIDNYYLLLALQHGLVAVALMVGIIGYIAVRLYRRGVREPQAEYPGSSLSFTLLGIYLAIGFSIATVYLGEQTLPLLFILTGWADAYLRTDPEMMSTSPATVAGQPEPRFRRLLT